MKVVLILPYLKAGGTERQASYIVNHLKSKGHHVILIAIESNSTFESIFDVSVTYLKSKNSYLRFIPNLYLLVKKLNQLNPDVVISRAWSTNVLTGISCLLTKTKYILFLSSSVNHRDKNFLKKLFHKIALTRANAIISVSRQSKINCVKYYSISGLLIHVVHNGVDINKLELYSKEKVKLPESLDESSILVLFVGGLKIRKGVDLLIKAISSLKNKDINLIIVGDGPERNSLKALTTQNGLDGKVYFLGQKVNPYPYMKKADVFVLPSRSEGFPNVLLEAMSLELSVIAANCEAGPNEIINDDNGILVDVNDIEGIRRALVLYSEDNILREKHGKQAKLTINEYHQISEQMASIEDIILSVVNEKS